MKKHLMTVLAENIEENKEVALVLVTKAEGSTPRGPGSMMVVNEEGAILGGTIGGGAGEQQAKEDAIKCLKRGISRAFVYNFNQKGKLAMACGGNIEIFIQVFKSLGKLAIVGAGHIGAALYQQAKMLGYQVVVLDNRESVATPVRFPEADELLVGNMVELLQDYPLDSNTSVVVVTHGHEFDQQVLEVVIKKPLRYLGMIGSSHKIQLCFANMKQKGFSQEELEKVHAPIGLDIGGERPEEIALAIMAEIQAVKYDRQGGFLLHKGK